MADGIREGDKDRILRPPSIAFVEFSLPLIEISQALSGRNLTFVCEIVCPLANA